MRRGSIVLAAAFATCLTFTTAPSLASSGVSRPGTVGAAARALTVTEESADGFAASFGRSTSYVTLESRRAPTGAVASTVRLGGKVFTATRDGARRSASWTGNGVVLTPADKAAITAMLAGAQQRVAQPLAARGARVPDHVDLGLRLMMLLAEAPAGVRIGTYDAPRPAARTETTTDLAATASRSSDEACVATTLRTTAPGSGVQAAALAACQVSHDQGILYMSCSTVNRTLRHDSAGHCFLAESVRSGPASSECLGECGPGCNGINAYTYDCGDHDRCGRVHGGSTNPWDAECGDEYWDADDDFLWGEINRC